MKKILTLAFLHIVLLAQAQWPDVKNNFTDSLHFPVAVAAGSQRNPIVINSYPDDGYFVIWEDDRNYATTKTDLYAQKYDAFGKRLWADGGIPIVNGPNDQHYTVSSNQDYRNRSYAATDSAGGFYIGYTDDSVTNYYWSRMAIQHVLSSGKGVFPGAGFIVIAPVPNEGSNFSSPQLIADGKRGCYIAYSRNTPGQNFLFVYDFREVGGVMKSFGGGWVNQNAAQRSEIAPCGIRYYIDYPGITVLDYAIWPDRQGGCNVVMSLNGNAGDQYAMLGFNKVFRAKKKSITKTYRRNTQGYACPVINQYDSGQVYVLYTFSKDRIETACGGSGGPVYVQASERVLSQGYLLMDQGAYNYLYPKGLTLSSEGNINVDAIAVMKRNLINNNVTNFYLQAMAYAAERYDSIPYQRTSYSNPDFGYNATPPKKMNTLAFFRDTILGTGSYYPDFSWAGGGANIYAASLLSVTGAREVKLQHLQLTTDAPGVFSIQRKTADKLGVAIGKEISTGFSGSNISYDHPLLSVDDYGLGVFYIREYYRSARISPIGNNAALTWGAMGRAVGTGVYGSNYYNLEQPAFALHSFLGSGLMAFRDNRSLPGNTGDNIFARNIDSLKNDGYKPPYKPVQLVPNPYGGTPANPAVLTGSSQEYSLIEVYSPYNKQTTSPLIELKDNFNYGYILATLYQNSSAIRRYNNRAYLDRNFSLSAENNPAGKTQINLRLFFTKTEFNALKATDVSIVNPGDLVIVQQPATQYPPTTYAPVAGEQLLYPIAWKAVDSGYYVEIRPATLGNFFLWKGETLSLCPGGTGTITSNISGGSYQWQVDVGGGFTNVVNNSNYAGATTNMLQLKNIPSSWSGYKYRCVIGGNNSTITVLRFTSSWMGTVNSNWENPANWSCGAVPDANTDVVINGGVVVVNAPAVCRTLTLTAGASVTVKPGETLAVKY